MELPSANQKKDALESVLSTMVDSLRTKAGGNLVSVVVFGSYLNQFFRPQTSDINLVVVLKTVDAESLLVVAPVLRAASIEARVEPMLIAEAEVQSACDVFPTKMLDIQRRHRVLFGSDPFAGLVVSKEHLRLRVEQELRNMSLRLRRTWVSAHSNPHILERRLSEIIWGLEIELAWLLSLVNKPCEDSQNPEEVFRSAHNEFGLDGDLLLEAFRRKLGQASQTPIVQLFAQVLETVTKAATIADSLSV